MNGSLYILLLIILEPTPQIKICHGDEEGARTPFVCQFLNYHILRHGIRAQINMLLKERAQAPVNYGLHSHIENWGPGPQSKML